MQNKLLISIVFVALVTFYATMFAPNVLGGCFSEKTSYGWPISIKITVHRCISCCQEKNISYPYTYINYIGLVVDILYYCAPVYIVKYFINKKFRKAPEKL